MLFVLKIYFKETLSDHFILCIITSKEPNKMHYVRDNNHYLATVRMKYGTADELRLLLILLNEEDFYCSVKVNMPARYYQVPQRGITL